MNQSAFYLTAFHGLWGLAMPAGCTNFYLVIEGHMQIQTPRQHMLLKAGDFALLLHDTPYQLTSPDWRSTADAPLRRPVDLTEKQVSARYRLLSEGPSKRQGPLSRFFCGALRFDRPLVYELIRHLPEVLRVEAREGPQQSQTLALVNLLIAESSTMNPGWEVVCNRVADTLILQAVRNWLAHQPGSGWLRALQDPALSKAVALMHKHPEHAWTLAELAEAAYLSRSTFAARFREITGETAMQYLTRARMFLALSQLRESDPNLSTLAQDLGYGSEAAFHRAFKRVHGFTPGHVKRQRQTRLKVMR